MDRRADISGARVGRVSRVMGWVTIGLIVALVVADVMLWIDRSILDRAIRNEILPPGTAYQLTPGVLAAAFLVGHVPFMITLWGLWNTLRLFRGYRDGAVFTVQAGQRLRNAGLALGALPFAQVLLSGVGSALLTMNNPEGQRHVAITLQDSHLIVGVAGGVLVVVGWVMAEAARIADDHSQIV